MTTDNALMTTDSVMIDHPTRRLVVTLPRAYDAACEHFETLVPEADLHRFYQQGSWRATLELAEINGPFGFMRYYRSDLCALMAGSPSLWKATQYLIGNHTIAERAFREEASAGLYAPMPCMIYADPDGDTKLAVDQPGLLFDSYGNPQIAEVGRELDARLAQLITLLGGQVLPHL
ncbi:hypothetical protein GCM10009630_34410 [Kribbella jejuensis]|uniref:DUF302 domain-containing protein n=1 Tax=Kribbella jejuensis TaxID=236068 RepID=A0A542DT08_9ACTN|nr:DUF302 domain-containing protein [Kribbella jejuensis]TQJ06220.1 hypothetical protein FB475_5875 [Kribbella jejuensis]